MFKKILEKSCNGEITGHTAIWGRAIASGCLPRILPDSPVLVSVRTFVPQSF
ncbi:MAG: hypothetical protein AAGA60_21905 [Cyanobacteria bacterium P01_E01_bin.42]